MAGEFGGFSSNLSTLEKQMVALSSTMRRLASDSSYVKYWSTASISIEKTTEMVKNLTSAYKAYYKEQNANTAKDLIGSASALKAFDKESFSDLMYEYDMEGTIRSAMASYASIAQQYSPEIMSALFSDLSKLEISGGSDIVNIFKNNAGGMQAFEELDIANMTIESLNNEIDRLEEKIKELGNSNTGQLTRDIESLKQTLASMRSIDTGIFERFLSGNGLRARSEDFQNSTDEKIKGIRDLYDSVRKGELTAAQATNRFKLQYSEFLGAGGENVQSDALLEFSSRLDEILQKLSVVQDAIEKLQSSISSGNFKLPESSTDGIVQDANVMSSVFESITSILSSSNSGSDFSYLTELAGVIKTISEIAKSDIGNLSQIRGIFENISNVGTLTVNTSEMTKLKASLEEIASVKNIGNLSAIGRIDFSGLSGLKISSTINSQLVPFIQSISQLDLGQLTKLGEINLSGLSSVGMKGGDINRILKLVDGLNSISGSSRSYANISTEYDPILDNAEESTASIEAETAAVESRNNAVSNTPSSVMDNVSTVANAGTDALEAEALAAEKASSAMMELGKVPAETSWATDTKSSISTIQTDIAGLLDSLNQLRGSLTTEGSAISAMMSEESGGSLTEFANNISSISASLSQLDFSKVSISADQLGEIKQIFEDLTKVIGELSEKSIKINTEDAEAKVAALEKQIEDLQNNINKRNDDKNTDAQASIGAQAAVKLYNQLNTQVSAYEAKLRQIQELDKQRSAENAGLYKNIDTSQYESVLEKLKNFNPSDASEFRATYSDYISIVSELDGMYKSLNEDIKANDAAAKAASAVNSKISQDVSANKSIEVYAQLNQEAEKYESMMTRLKSLDGQNASKYGDYYQKIDFSAMEQAISKFKNNGFGSAEELRSGYSSYLSMVSAISSQYDTLNDKIKTNVELAKEASSAAQSNTVNPSARAKELYAGMDSQYQIYNSKLSQLQTTASRLGITDLDTSQLSGALGELKQFKEIIGSSSDMQVMYDEYTAQLVKVSKAAELVSEKIKEMKAAMEGAKEKDNAYDKYSERFDKISQSIDAVIEKYPSMSKLMSTSSLNSGMQAQLSGFKNNTVNSDSMDAYVKRMENYVKSMKSFASMEKAINSASSKASSNSNVVGNKEAFFGYTEAIDNAKEKYADFAVKLQQDPFYALSEKGKAELDALRSSVLDIGKAWDDCNSKFTQSSTSSAMDSAITKVEAFSKRYSNALRKYDIKSGAEDGKGLYDQLVSLQEKIRTSSIDAKGINQELSTLQYQAQQAGISTDTLGQKLLKVFKNRMSYMMTGMMFMKVRQAFKEMYSNVKEIDASMAQLEIVTGASGNTLDSYFERASAAAQKLGASITDVLDSVQTFSRLGYNFDEAMGLSEAATMLSNVADTTVDESTTGLTSIVKGFGLDATDATLVADELVAVGQSYAISASELMEAFENGGSSLAAAGNTLEETMAIFAAGNASVQNASTVGTAMKTTAARIRSATAELDEMGEEYDDLVASSSKYRAEIKALSGVDIMIDDNTYKSTYTILKEIASVYDNISDVSQAALLEDLFGKRNTNVGLSIITNLKDLEGAYDTASNAAGTATDANDVYMDTIEAKTAQMKASFEQLSNTFISSDFAKGAVDALTKLIQLLDTLMNNIGSLGTIVTGVFAFKALDKAWETIKPMIDGIGLFSKQAELLKNAAKNAADNLGITNTASTETAGANVATDATAAASGESAGASFAEGMESTMTPSVAAAEAEAVEAGTPAAAAAASSGGAVVGENMAQGVAVTASAEVPVAEVESVEAGATAAVAAGAEVGAEVGEAMAAGVSSTAGAGVSAAVTETVGAGVGAAESGGVVIGETAGTAVATGLSSALAGAMIGVLAYSIIKRQIAKYTKELQDAASESFNDFSLDIDALGEDGDYASKIKEYYDVINSSDSSESAMASAKINLIQLQSELNEKIQQANTEYYGGIDLLHGQSEAYQSLSSAADAYLQAQAKIKLAENSSAYTMARGHILGANESTFKFKSDNEEANKVFEDFMAQHGVSLQQPKKGKFELFGSSYQNLKDLEQLRDDLLSIDGLDESEVSSISNAISKIKSYTSEWEKYYEAEIQLKITANTDYGNIVEDIGNFSVKASEAVANGEYDDFSEAYASFLADGVQAGIDAIPEDDWSVANYLQEMLDDTSDSFHDYIVAFQLGVDIEDNPDTEDAINEYIDGLIEETEDGERYLDLTNFELIANGASVGDISGITQEEMDAYNGLQELASSLGILGEDGTGDVMSLLSAFALLSGIVTSLTPTFSDVGESAVASYTDMTKAVNTLKEAVESLNQAQSEMAQSGELSSSTALSLLGQLTDTGYQEDEEGNGISYLDATGRSVSDFLKVENGQLQLNTRAWNEYSVAKYEGLKADNAARISELEEEAAGIDTGDYADRQRYIAITEELVRLRNDEKAYDEIIQMINEDTSTLFDSFDDVSSISDAFTEISDAMSAGGTTVEQAMDWIQEVPELAKYFDQLLDGSLDVDNVLNSLARDQYSGQISLINKQLEETTDPTKRAQLMALAEAYSYMANTMYTTGDGKYSSIVDQGLPTAKHQNIINQLAKGYDDVSLDDIKSILGIDDGLDAVAGEYLSSLSQYYADYAYAVELGWEKTQSAFGNIDFNNRGVLQWNSDNLAQYSKEIQEWMGSEQPVAGDISTVLGSWDWYGDSEVKIAFSPLLDDGSGSLSLLSKDTMTDYLDEVVNRAVNEGYTGEGLFDRILEIDRDGLDVNGELIHGMITGIGEEAEKISELTHFVGENGAISLDAEYIKESYQELKKYAKTMGDVNDAQTDASRTQKRLQNLWSSDVFSDARGELEDLADEAGITASDILELAEDNKYLSYLMDATGLSATYLAQIFENLSANGTSALEDITQQAVRLNQVLGQMEKPLRGASKALDEYDNAKDSWDYDDNYERYQQVWQDYFESAYGQDYDSYKSGDKPDNIQEYGADFWRSAETLVGDDYLKKIGYDPSKTIKHINDTVGKWMKDDDNGYKFLNDVIKQKSQIAGLSDEFFAYVDKQGNKHFNIPTEDFAALAEHFGTTEEVIASCVSALGMFGDYSVYTLDDLKQAFTGYDDEIKNASDETVYSYQELQKMLADQGLEDWQIGQTIEDIKNIDGVKIYDLDNAEQAKQYLADYIDTVTEGGKKLNLGDLADKMFANGYSKDYIASMFSGDTFNKYLEENGIEVNGGMTPSEYGSYLKSGMTTLEANAIDARNKILEKTGTSMFEDVSDLANVKPYQTSSLEYLRDSALQSEDIELANAYQAILEQIYATKKNISTTSMSASGVEYMDKLREYSKSVSQYGVDSEQAQAAKQEVTAYAEELGGIPEEVQTTLGVTTNDEALQGIEEGTVTVGVTLSTEEMISQIMESTSTIASMFSEDGATVTVNAETESAMNQLQAIDDKITEINGKSATVSVSTTGSTGGTSGQTSYTNNKQKRSTTQVVNTTVNTKANTSGATSALSGVQKAASAAAGSYSVRISANIGNAMSGIRTVMSAIKNLRDRTINITTNYKTTGKPAVNGTLGLANGSLFGNAYAKGKIGTASGMALTGELGEELVVDPNTSSWYTVGTHGAEFTNLPAGAIVFNHKQTEALFKNGKVAGRGRAHVNGTALATGTINKNAYTGQSWRSGSSSANKTSTGSSSSKADNEKEKLDLIEILLDRIERKISHFDTIATSAYRTYKTRADATRSEIDLIQQERDAQKKGGEEYLAQAKAVGTSAYDSATAKALKKAKISESDLNTYKDKVANGELSIMDIENETLQKVLEEFKEYYDKYLDTVDKEDELTEKLGDAYKRLFDDINSEFESIMKQFDNTQTLINNAISRIENSGGNVDKSYYEQLIANENKNIAKTLEKRDALQKKLNEAVDSGAIEVGSEAWYEMQDAIDQCNIDIDNSMTSISDWNSKIRQIDWDSFDRGIAKIERLNSEADFFLDLLDDMDSFDEDTGAITEEGIAKIGLRVQKYDTLMAEAAKYSEEIAKIDAELEANPGNQALIDRKNELVDAQQNAIKSANEEKKALKELKKDGVDTYLDALEKLIDKYKDARDSARDMYEYQRDIADKTEEVLKLQKQLAAYAGDDSEETRATVQKLQVSLKDAQEELKDTQYDQLVSDMDDILDDMYDDIEEFLNNALDDIDATFEWAVNMANNNANTTQSVIREVGDENGYTISEEMSSIWGSGVSYSTIFTSYGNNILNSHTGIINAINNIDVSSATEQSAAAIKEQMANNSKAMVNATSDEKKALVEQNTRLAKQLSELTSKSVTRSGDYWYIDGQKIGEEIAIKYVDTIYKNGVSSNRTLSDVATADISSIMSGLTGAFAYNTSSGNNTNNMNVTFTLPNVSNYTEFMRAAQRDKNFASLISNLVVNGATGSTKLSKNSVVFK